MSGCSPAAHPIRECRKVALNAWNTPSVCWPAAFLRHWPFPTRCAQWFADYVSLVVERDVMALSRLRQRAQLLNVSEAARSVSLEASTAENYTQLLESVFLIHRLPAWGTTLGAKVGASPKVHMVDSGVAGNLLRITPEKLTRRLPQALTEYGHVLESFVVNEVLKQASWLPQPVVTGHWRDRGGDEVDLVLERTDGLVVGIEVKAAAQARASDASGLLALARRLGGQWLGAWCSTPDTIRPCWINSATSSRYGSNRCGERADHRRRGPTGRRATITNRKSRRVTGRCGDNRMSLRSDVVRSEVSLYPASRGRRCGPAVGHDRARRADGGRHGRRRVGRAVHRR